MSSPWALEYCEGKIFLNEGEIFDELIKFLGKDETGLKKYIYSDGHLNMDI